MIFDALDIWAQKYKLFYLLFLKKKKIIIKKHIFLTFFFKTKDKINLKFKTYGDLNFNRLALAILSLLMLPVVSGKKCKLTVHTTQGFLFFLFFSLSLSLNFGGDLHTIEDKLSSHMGTRLDGG